MQSPETITDKIVVDEQASARRWAIGALAMLPIIAALWLALVFGALYVAVVAWNGFRFAAGF